jgi:hypothetical protein
LSWGTTLATVCPDEKEFGEEEGVGLPDAFRLKSLYKKKVHSKKKG